VKLLEPARSSNPEPDTAFDSGSFAAKPARTCLAPRLRRHDQLYSVRQRWRTWLLAIRDGWRNPTFASEQPGSLQGEEQEKYADSFAALLGIDFFRAGLAISGNPSALQLSEATVEAGVSFGWCRYTR